MKVLDSPTLRNLPKGQPIHPFFCKPLPDGRWIKKMQRLCRAPGLVVLQNKWGPQCVIAEWVVKPKRWGQGPASVIELAIISGNPDTGPRDLPSDEWMRARARPQHEVAKDMLKLMKALRKDQQMKKMSSAAQAKDVAKHLRKKVGMEEAAARLQMGEIPFIGDDEGGEDLEQMREDLITMAKGVND